MSKPSNTSIRRVELLNGQPSKILFRLSVPMIVGLISVIGFNLIDTFFISKLGTSHLAAMGFIFPVVFIFSTVAIGMGTGTASIISRTIGEGNTSLVKMQASHSLYLGVLIVVVCASFGLITIDPLFTALGARGEILNLIRDYMTIWYFGLMFLVVPIIGNSIVRASGNTVFPGMIMAISAIANVILDPILIFGFGPIEAYGMKGAAIATVISRAITLVASLYMLVVKEDILEKKLPDLKIMFSSWKKLLIIGLPATATNIVTPLTTAFVTKIMANFGSSAVAGFTIIGRVESLGFVIIYGLSSAIVPFVGQNFGANLIPRIKSGVKSAIIFCVIWGAVVTSISYGLNTEIPLIFSSQKEVIAVAALFLVMVPVTYAAEAFRLVISSSLFAINKPVLSSSITISKAILFTVPLVLILNQHYGIVGVFYALAISNIISGLISLIAFRSTLNKIAA
jgi:putative MATE family efflux protein